MSLGRLLLLALALLAALAAAAASQATASHILVAKEEQAKDLYEQIKGGADFAALARAHSTWYVSEDSQRALLTLDWLQPLQGQGWQLGHLQTRSNG